MSAALNAMVVAAARALCKRGAEQCNVNFEDSWKLYGNDYLEDARTAFKAASVDDLLDTVVRLEYAAMDITCERTTIRNAARAAIAKAEGTS